MVDHQESIDELIERLEQLRPLSGHCYVVALDMAFPRLRDEIRRLRLTPREIGIAAADSADRAVAEERE